MSALLCTNRNELFIAMQCASYVVGGPYIQMKIGPYCRALLADATIKKEPEAFAKKA